MITAVAFCPQAPALVPALGRGLDTELGPVRVACRTAIRRVAATASGVVVVGAAPVTATHGPTARGSLAPWGVRLDVPAGAATTDVSPSLPAALTVGAWLVADALGPDADVTYVSVGDGTAHLPDVDPAGDTAVALVVVGDGSARRSEKAPGHLDPRAEAFDARLAAALAAGDVTALTDQRDAVELLAAGAPAWTAVARALDGVRWDPELLYDGAPFGVGYVVATWLRA